MAERQLVVDKERISYEGLFLVKDLIKLFYEWCSNKGYVPIESKHSEVTKDDGKYVEIDFDPFKKVTDFSKNVFKIKLLCSNVTDIIMEQEGQKKKLNQGKIQLVFTGWLETDYEHRWETKPIFYVIRTFFEKYVYGRFVAGYHTAIKKDLKELQDSYKAYLNLYKYV